MCKMIAYLSSIAVLWGSSATTAGQEVNLDQVIEVARANTAPLRSVQMSFVEESTRESGQSRTGGPLIVERHVNAVCGIAFDRFHWKLQQRSELDEMLRPPVWTTFPGADGPCWYYFPDEARGALRPEPPTIRKNDATPLRIGLLFPPAEGGLGPDDLSIMSLLNHARVAGREVVFGQECVIVEALVNDGKYATAWLDLQRGALPIKGVTWGKNGAPVATSLIFEAKAFTDDNGKVVWLPTRMEQKITVSTGTVAVTTSVDENSVQINPETSPDSFKIEYPRGTILEDYRETPPTRTVVE